jgi:DNA-binding SARP family transcriptional activator
LTHATEGQRAEGTCEEVSELFSEEPVPDKRAKRVLRFYEDADDLAYASG